MHFIYAYMSLWIELTHVFISDSVLREFNDRLSRQKHVQISKVIRFCEKPIVVTVLRCHSSFVHCVIFKISDIY